MDSGGVRTQIVFIILNIIITTIAKVKLFLVHGFSIILQITNRTQMAIISQFNQFNVLKKHFTISILCANKATYAHLQPLLGLGVHISKDT